ncbi:RNA polymerase [Bacillus paranthracis]|uniref:RNA polymerase n=1 Tax=Bacillus paranthracis TaxID=2026186 RepID=UPI0018792498|nr:RNA polymerase [Bacillus paranthracis]MBE7114347.1 RNA polymerase [Bacillus paranthracis]MBE7154780.1 RNA polymerase [Bacillus paranthracis]
MYNVEELKGKSIEELNMPKGTIMLLQQNNVHTLHDLLQKTEDDFMQMVGVPQRKATEGVRIVKRYFGRKELHLILLEIEKYKEQYSVN